MISVTSAEFQKHFGHFRREALNSPINISVHGQNTLVMLSATEYERLRAIEAEGRKPQAAKASKPAPTFKASARSVAAAALADKPAPEANAVVHSEHADLERIAAAGAPAIRFHDVLDPDS